MPRPPQCQYFEAQSHTPFDRCVRFVVVVTFHAATLATRRTLLPTWAGLAPAGSRQLRLAHHHILLAGLPAHLCENTSVQVLMQSPSEQRRPNPSSCSDCSYQCGSAEDSDCPFQVVGEDVEAHLGSDLVQGPGQEVDGAHPSLEGPERVFDGLSSHAHGVGHVPN